jgi:chromosomal replication initiation ATPase DnaA
MNILNIASQVTGVSVEEIKGMSRMQHISEARYITFFVLHQKGMSFTAIGKAMNRHHTTVMHGCCVIEGHMKNSLYYGSRTIQEKVNRIVRVIDEVNRQADESMISQRAQENEA